MTTDRRDFLAAMTGGAAAVHLGLNSSVGRAAPAKRVTIGPVRPDEDVVAYLRRVHGSFQAEPYKQVLGAANEFKEGDEIVGVAADDPDSRRNARRLLANTSIRTIDRHPPWRDELFGLIRSARDPAAAKRTARMTLGQLKKRLIEEDATSIRAVMGGLSSDVIACVVKLMSNEELVTVGAKVFNPLPGSHIGAKGYLGARIQPNSPTDNLDDIRWQVFDGWSYAVGDVVLGTNPVSSEAGSVEAIELALKDLLVTFDLADVLPHCVLSHIGVQAEVERNKPESTALWFQSIAGCDDANRTFDVSVSKMLEYASRRAGRFGLYFETGQGADFTNGHSQGCDMVVHESRKYGFARALKRRVEDAVRRTGGDSRPWVHLNDVAGFIGPEVFRTREQLVRCCLEDIVMGKLHGLCIGLDVCSTLHMDVTLDDLDWCLAEVMPACPAYLMALPTKIDPMLGYLTTGYQDHVRLRDRFGYKVNDSMWRFFQEIEVIDRDGRPGAHFGDPLSVFLKYRRRRGDDRDDQRILEEGRRQMESVRRRGVFLATGHGARPWDPRPDLDSDIRRIYADAKKSIWAELNPTFVDTIPDAVRLASRSADRTDYILHPESGERLSVESQRRLEELRQVDQGRYDAQIVVSDGLNALSIMDPNQLLPFLRRLRTELDREGFRPSPRHLVLRSGRVRAGYRIGETLFADLPGSRAVLHVIGERPGTGHHTFSVYVTAPDGNVWGRENQVDHNITKVVSGIATTALSPDKGAAASVRVLKMLFESEVP